LTKELYRSLAEKTSEAFALSKELETYYMLKILDISKEDINGRRRLKTNHELYQTHCQIRMKNGDEHIVPIELIY